MIHLQHYSHWQKIRSFGLIIVCLYLNSLSLLHSEPATIEKVQGALQYMQAQELDEWSFDSVERNNQTVYRMTYHAIVNGKGEITLLDINGKPPTEKEIESFEKDHPSRKPREIEKEGIELTEIIVPDSLQFESSLDGISVFSFLPQFAFDKQPKSDYPLKGSIEFDESESFIKQFHVSTKESFKPKFGMKIINFDLQLEFDKHESGAVLTKKVHTQFEGKAFLLVPIKQDIEIDYFNYQMSPEQ